MVRKVRQSSHKIETLVKNNVRKVIDKGDFLYRELSERDYGIDAIIEYFNNEEITGKIALIQLKGTSGKIKSLVNKPVISCPISTSNAFYALQNNIPVILIYASLSEENIFYYTCLQDIDFDIELLEFQKTITVHIPVENIIEDDMTDLIQLLDKYYT